MIKYADHKDDVLVSFEPDAIYEIDGSEYKAWDVELADGIVRRIAEFNMECAVTNEDGTYKPEDYDIAFYASDDDTLRNINYILYN